MYQEDLVSMIDYRRGVTVAQECLFWRLLTWSDTDRMTNHHDNDSTAFWERFDSRDEAWLASRNPQHNCEVSDCQDAYAYEA